MTRDYSNIEVRSFAQMILRILSAGFMFFFSLASLLYFYKAYEVRQNNDLIYVINELHTAEKELNFSTQMPSVYNDFNQSAAKQKALNHLARDLGELMSGRSGELAAEYARFERSLDKNNGLLVLFNGLIARALSEFEAFNLLYVGTGESELRQRVLGLIFSLKVPGQDLKDLMLYALSLQDRAEEELLELTAAQNGASKTAASRAAKAQIELLNKKSEFFLKTAALLRTMGEINELRAKLLSGELSENIKNMRQLLSAVNERLLGEQARILAAAVVLFMLGAAFTAANFYYGFKISKLLSVFFKTFMRSPVQQSLIRINGKEFSSELTNNAFRFGSGMLKNIAQNMRSDAGFYGEIDRVLALDDDTRGFEVGTLVYESHSKMTPYTDDLKVNRKDGKFYTIFRRQISPEFELINKIDVSKMIWQIKDLKERLDSLRRKLEHDDLTQMLSLQALQDNEINNPKGSTNKIFLYLHIDNFSDVRLNYSTVVIDEIIKTFAQSLRNALDSADNHEALLNTAIYHLQLDEFAIVYDSLAAAQEAAMRINNHFKNQRHNNDTRNKFDLKFGPGEKLVDLELNIGISSERDITRQRGGGAKESINRLAQAIIASYESARIKAPYVIYEENRLGVEIQYFKQQHMSSQIRDALASDNIFLVAQGVHDSRSLQPKYYELLVRMRDAEGATVPPGMFLDIARRVGLYKDIQRVVISKAFALLETFPQASFSVNLANSDIVSAETRRFFLSKLERCERADHLCVEILESEGIEQYDEIASFLNEVKSRGAKVAIDDFGSGYSNYYRLLKVQFDYLKVDGSIIAALPNDQNAHVVLKTIVEFAHEQGYEVVAEFVSSAEILQIIREYGIDKSQGYELSRPEVPEVIFA